MSLADTIQADMKAALKAGDKSRLNALRLAVAAIKQREVDTRETLTDDGVVAVLQRMIKQGRDAQAQFEAAGRTEQAAKEAAEIATYEKYLPARLDADEVRELIADVLTATGASDLKDMGKVMGMIKARAAGRVDMAEINRLVRAQLTAK